MNFKTLYYIFGVILLSTLVSCLGDSYEEEYFISPDAEITAFSIKNDAISTDLANVVFSIDQKNGLIYNQDSAQYGLVLSEKVILTISNVVGGWIYNIADNDSTLITTGDSIDLSTKIKIRSYSATGQYKDYSVMLNIHQVDPDSMVWKKTMGDIDFLETPETKTILNNDIFYTFSKEENKVNLYSYSYSDLIANTKTSTITNLPSDAVLEQIQSYKDNVVTFTNSGDLYKASKSDMSVWNKIELDAGYLVRAVLGTVDKIDALSLIVNKGEGNIYALYKDNSWLYGSKVPENFPLQSFSSISYTNVEKGRLFVSGGITATSCSTIDGLEWMNQGNSLPGLIQAANIFRYNNQFYLLNGKSTTYNQIVYSSVDQGNTWQESASKMNLPKEYTYRENASVVIDSNNKVYIIGGKNDARFTPDIWEGKLNKLN